MNTASHHDVPIMCLRHDGQYKSDTTFIHSCNESLSASPLSIIAFSALYPPACLVDVPQADHVVSSPSSPSSIPPHQHLLPKHPILLPHLLRSLHRRLLPRTLRLLQPSARRLPRPPPTHLSHQLFSLPTQHRRFASAKPTVRGQPTRPSDAAITTCCDGQRRSPRGKGHEVWSLHRSGDL